MGFREVIIVIILYNKVRTTMQQSTDSQGQTPEPLKFHKNKYEFGLQRNRRIVIDSDFDNGNISLLKQISELQYRLEAVPDFKTSSPKKTWFHFRVSAPKAVRLRLTIENVAIFENMYEDKDWARPVFNDGTGWKQIKETFLTYRGEVGIVIDHTFASQSFVYFALTVPHSYTDSENYLRELGSKIPDHIFYEDEILGKSYGGLNLHMLRLTAKQEQHRLKQANSSAGHLITLQPTFNDKKSNVRVHSQASIDRHIGYGNIIRKPIVLITCRVHPGEVGSTHCLMGIIDFLTRVNNLQSLLLLRMFEFMIIPIVNPDGVFQGNYRMDLHNTNLNRVYNDPCPQLHPTIHIIKQRISSLVFPNIGNPNWPKQKIDRFLSIISRKIMFHFDLHSHSCNKPAFIYGNAFDQIVTQTQSQLYCRILEQNCGVFRYGASQFGERHMKMKDKGELLTKEGCARVVIGKMANIIYSYTVETSIFPYLTRNDITQPNNQHYKFSDQYGYEGTNLQELSVRFNTKNKLMLDNIMLGHSLMVSVLDVMEKNPYSRYSNPEETLDAYRKEISQALLQGEERFKLLDIKAYQKVRNISKFCKEEIANKNLKYWDYLANDKSLLSGKWPNCFKMFQYSGFSNPDLELFRRKNRFKTEANESQRQASDFINPKNTRKRIMNMEIEGSVPAQSQVKQPKTEISPTKSLVSPRNIHIQLDFQANINGPTLPDIRQRKNKASSLFKHHQPHRNTEESDTKKQAQTELKEIRELKQLHKKDSTKNIVLSFIHEQMQRINTIRRNAQKSMAVQSRLASYKLIKKASRSSSKIITQLATVNSSSANRYGIALNNNATSSNTHSSDNLNSLSLTKDKSKKKVNSLETCEEIVNRRKICRSTTQDREEFEEEEGIYYVNEDKDKDRKSDNTSEDKMKQGERIVGQKLNLSRIPTNLERISQYPVFTSDKDKDTSMLLSSKRELVKVKYSQLKKKNIIKQDINNNNFKLPELRGISSTLINGSYKNIQEKSEDHQEPAHSNRNNKGNNGVSINVNLNLNLNLCIEREFEGRARAATMPDEGQ